jgi:NTE family protein
MTPGSVELERGEPGAEELLTPPVRPRTLLVLGGGGMKGIAHVGVVKALEEAGIRPDAIVGTSIGALVGALLAGGLGWRELMEITRKLRKDDVVAINRRALWLGGIRAVSVFQAEPFQEWVERILPAFHFDELMIPLRINAASLVTGGEVWFGSGRRKDVELKLAIYASCALPVYFPPLAVGDDLLVDGGVVNALPLSEAGAWGAERIVAVDVGSDLVPPREGFLEQGLIAIHDRVLNLNLVRQRERCLERHRDMPFLHIRPRVGHIHTFDFDRTQFFLEEGYRAAREALEAVAAA